MNAQEMLITLKDKGIHLTIINLQTGISYQKLIRCLNEGVELREGDYRTLGRYASHNGVDA